MFLKIAFMMKRSLSIQSDGATNMTFADAPHGAGEAMPGNSRTTCSARFKDSHRLIGEIAVASESWQSSRGSA